jgi:hypothetical protein
MGMKLYWNMLETLVPNVNRNFIMEISSDSVLKQFAKDHFDFDVIIKGIKTDLNESDENTLKLMIQTFKLMDFHDVRLIFFSQNRKKN